MKLKSLLGVVGCMLVSGCLADGAEPEDTGVEQQGLLAKIVQVENGVVDYRDTTVANLGGGCGTTGAGVDRALLPTSTTNCYVGWIKSGEWITYDVNLTTVANKEVGIVFRFAAEAAGKQLRVLMDGTDVTGLVTLPSSGGKGKYLVSQRFGRFTPTAGVHRIKLSFQSSDGLRLDWLKFLEYPGVDQCTATGTDALIDDLEDGDDTIAPSENRYGYWYTFHAGTCTPAPGADFTPTAPGNASGYAAYTSGTGCTAATWSGGGMGFEFQQLQAGLSTPCAAYNATAYAGLTFNIKGTGTVRVQVCTSDVLDDNCHGYDVTGLTGTYRSVSVPFTALTQEDWGSATVPVVFQKSHLKKIQFKAATAAYNMWVDDIAFTN